MDNAVANAVDGTLVSVVRDSVSGLSGSLSTTDLIERWLARARAELAKTPQQLQDPKTGQFVLQQAEVVDSGAQVSSACQSRAYPSSTHGLHPYQPYIVGRGAMHAWSSAVTAASRQRHGCELTASGAPPGCRPGAPGCTTTRRPAHVTRLLPPYVRACACGLTSGLRLHA